MITLNTIYDMPLIISSMCLFYLCFAITAPVFEQLIGGFRVKKDKLKIGIVFNSIYFVIFSLLYFFINFYPMPEKYVMILLLIFYLIFMYTFYKFVYLNYEKR